MRCERVQFLYSEYSAGTLPASTMARVEEHLAACAACREFYEESDRIGALIRREGQVAHPGPAYFDDLAARVLGELDKAPPPRVTIRRMLRVRPLWWAGAAAAVVLMSLAIAPELRRSATLAGDGGSGRLVSFAAGPADAPEAAASQAPAAPAPSSGTILVKGVSNPAEPTTKLDEILPGPPQLEKFKSEFQAGRDAQVKMANAGPDKTNAPLDRILEEHLGGGSDPRRGMKELESALRGQGADPSELANRPIFKQSRYYFQGEDELAAGRPNEAYEYFQRVLLVDQTTAMAVRANLQIADILFSEKANFKQALSYYRKCQGSRANKALNPAERLRVQRQIELLQQYRADDWQALALVHSLRRDPWPEALAALRVLAAAEKDQPLLPDSARAIVDRFAAGDKPGSESVMEIYNLLADKAQNQPGGESRAYLELYLGELSVHLAQSDQAVEHFMRATAAAEGSVAAGIARNKIKELQDQKLNYRVRNWN